MIPVQELRIGNYVMSSTGAPCTVKRIGYDPCIDLNPFDETHTIFCLPEEVNPIPLTEEWLKEFGFGASDECEMGHNTNKHFGFYFDWHFKRFRLDVDDGENGLEIRLDIRYVHQLQNLYFALTGEELKRKEFEPKEKEE